MSNLLVMRRMEAHVSVSEFPKKTCSLGVRSETLWFVFLFTPESCFLKINLLMFLVHEEENGSYFSKLFAHILLCFFLLSNPVLYHLVSLVHVTC